jgi:hypothetical protein
MSFSHVNTPCRYGQFDLSVLWRNPRATKQRR